LLELAIKNNETVRGSLFLDDRVMPGFSKLNPSVISITERFQPERARVERFIEATFEKAYGAHLPGHYPTLMSVHNAEGDILAAVGFRFAEDGPLFLEQYLPDPIETQLTTASGEPVDRKTITEIGSLASAGGGASLFLFIALVAYLKSHGLTHAAVTATRELRSAFRFLRLSPTDLGRACSDDLPDHGAQWGSYYETEPRVLAGSLAATYARLEKFIPEQQNQGMARLFSRLHYDLEGDLAEGDLT